MLARQSLNLPLRPGPARVAGAGLVAAGAGMCVIGISRFTGVEEVTGTRNQTLLTTGIYRYSRNPQYLGYLLVLTGVSLTRRSAAGLLSTAALASAYSGPARNPRVHSPSTQGSVASLRWTKMTRRVRILMSLSFAIPIAVGASLGYFALRDAPDLLTLSVLAVTGGALTSVVVEEMLTEAHEGETSRLGPVALTAGFAIFALISVYIG